MMEYDIKKLVDGLTDLRAMLAPGPCSANECEGCRFEMIETLQIINNLLDGKDASDHWGDPVPHPKKES
jgi:hypothetical protein